MSDRRAMKHQRPPVHPGDVEALRTSIAAHGVLHTLAGDEETAWQVPEEVPLAVQFNSQNYAVMMGTPADFEDFAIGFAIAEGLIAKASDVTAVLVLPTEQGYAIDLSVPENRINRDRMAKRSLEGRTGCGLCGIENMKDAIRMPSSVLPAVELRPQAVARAYEQLPTHQPMSRVNRTVHAAAWCSVDGEILLSREDVGRHNALDKLIGALAQAAPVEGALVLTCRTSIDMVQKAAAAGFPMIIAASAPTAAAVDMADAAGITLVALARKDGFEVFTHTNRIAALEAAHVA
jgi:FdhD protein